MKKLFALLLAAGTAFAQSPAPAKRPMNPSDVMRLQLIGDPQVSPDGAWVAYVQSSVDTSKDKRNADLWMVSWDGKQSVQLTNSPDGESSPRWSPDGKYLSFLSSRNGATGAQLWLMDRRGGEGKKVTDIKGELEEYEWAPDGKRIAFVIRDKDYSDSAKTKVRTPYVIDRYHFKEDVKGYLDRRAAHIYLYDLEKKSLDTLTKGQYDESSPVWSPDGTRIAFVSNRTPDPDRNENTDIWVVDTKKGASIKQLTNWPGIDNNPQWSPDGKRIAYLRSTAPDNFIMYDQPILSIISADGGEPTLLSKALDRPAKNPRWSPDGQSIGVLVDDDRRTYVATYTLTGQLTKVAAGDRAFGDLEPRPNGGWAALMSEPQLPTEVYAIENGNVRRLTTVQDEFVAPLQLASVEGFTSKSKDGTQVSNLLFKPANASVGQRLPAIFFIHGGPVGQDNFGFDLSRQMLAAGGFAVIGVNYRGSNGRGLDYCKTIYSDWGNKEVSDILGAVDYTVKNGIADPDRLGIGGWSYGGILTNYSIATDPLRFKAAASGAGSSMQLSMYGSDQYVNQYENELGQPWKAAEKWLKLSYPFLKADRIKTPTLFMGGEKDFNVPIAGSEQMYQALKSQNVPTQLVIYPGQFHGISTPSYQKDRFVRYLDWFGTYLKPKVVAEKH